MKEDKDHTRRPLEKLKINLELFTSGFISELVSSVTEVSTGVGSYREVFTKEAKEQESSGEKDNADTLQILHIVVDMSLQVNDTKNPFQPSSWIGNARSPIPEDFTEEQVSELADSLPPLSDPRLTARIADVVWVRLKRIDAAHKAIDAYLQAVCDANMMDIVRYWCLERAFRLSKQINSNEHWKKCESLFDECRRQPDFYDQRSIEFLSLAKDLHILDDGVIAKEALAQAENALEKDPHGAEQLFSLAASLFQKLNQSEEAATCHKKVAERYLQIAEGMDALGSVSFIENAIEALQRAGATKAEIQEVNKLLTSKGKESIAQMKRVEGPRVDFTNQVKSAKEFVKGLAPFEGFRRVALQFPVLSYEDHKKSVEASIKEHPLMHFIGAKYFSDKGRQYSRRPSFMTDDAEEQQVAMNTEIWASMALHHQALTQFSLIHALSELHWSTKDLVRLGQEICNRPIVPPDRAEMFFLGIRAGLFGDFCEGAHILIPQLENSLRFLLEARGLSVVQVGSDLLHSEMLLNPLFETYRDELEQIFGSADLVFIIESFLCRKWGENFRNEMAHGLIATPTDYRFAFAWWLTVYLLFALKFPEPMQED